MRKPGLKGFIENNCPVRRRSECLEASDKRLQLGRGDLRTAPGPRHPASEQVRWHLDIVKSRCLGAGCLGLLAGRGRTPCIATKLRIRWLGKKVAIGDCCHGHLNGWRRRIVVRFPRVRSDANWASRRIQQQFPTQNQRRGADHGNAGDFPRQQKSPRRPFDRRSTRRGPFSVPENGLRQSRGRRRTALGLLQDAPSMTRSAANAFS